MNIDLQSFSENPLEAFEISKTEPVHIEIANENFVIIPAHFFEELIQNPPHIEANSKEIAITNDNDVIMELQSDIEPILPIALPLTSTYDATSVVSLEKGQIVNSLPKALAKQRQTWLTAYQNQDITTMGLIETRDFFVIHYDNVEKKSDWHNNVKNIHDENDVLLLLVNNHCPCKVRYDQMNTNSYIITSSIKAVNQLILLKEMWEQQDGWQINSLAIAQVRSR